MIIDINGNIHSNSMFPNTDWTGEAKYVIDDNSELANKIVNDCPYGYTPIEDGNGNLIDITPTEEPLETAILNKTEEIGQTMSNTIIVGIDYNNEHYTLTEFDQTAIIARGSQALDGKSVSWHPDGESCRIYTAQEFLPIYIKAYLHIIRQQTYANQLKQYVKSLTTVDEINNVTYGDELTGTYLENYNAIMTLEKANLGVTDEDI